MFFHFKRGNRSLALLMSASDQPTNAGEPVVQQQARAEEESEEGDYEVPDEIE